jgi:hypothetical protein
MAVSIKVEHTDTFGGESNYSWVRRHALEVKTDSRLAIVRAAKKATGFNGIKSKVHDFGDMIEIRPAGLCQIAFITFD